MLFDVQISKRSFKRYALLHGKTKVLYFYLRGLDNNVARLLCRAVLAVLSDAFYARRKYWLRLAKTACAELVDNFLHRTPDLNVNSGAAAFVDGVFNCGGQPGAADKHRAKPRFNSGEHLTYVRLRLKTPRLSKIRNVVRRALGSKRRNLYKRERRKFYCRKRRKRRKRVIWRLRHNGGAKPGRGLRRCYGRRRRHRHIAQRRSVDVKQRCGVNHHVSAVITGRRGRELRRLNVEKAKIDVWARRADKTSQSGVKVKVRVKRRGLDCVPAKRVRRLQR